MKKSLIALAVLAASGASFAQVSVTGNLTYGYQSQTNGGTTAAPSNAEVAGFGAETAYVLFTAKEDLGGGYAATASMKLKTGVSAAGTTANHDDHSLTLATPVGGLVMGTATGADYLSGGVAGVGSYNSGWDGKLFTARTLRDYVAFVAPVGAVTFSLSQHEAANTAALGVGVGGTGVSSVTDAASSNGAITTLSATYTAGPLVANGQYATWKANQTAGHAKDAYRLSASYDLGMVKLGAGMAVTNSDNGGAATLSPKTTDYLVAARMPMGASSFGLSFGNRTIADNPANGATPATFSASGYALEYGYAMSKRTSVIANYGRWTPFTAAAVAVGQEASTQYQVLLAHSF